MFPSLEKILKIDIEKLRLIGLTDVKVQAIKTLTFKTLNKEFDFQNQKETIEQLLAIKGIGKWTINILKMHCLKNNNLFPEKDLGLQKGMQMFFNLNKTPNEKQVAKYLKEVKKYKTFLANSFWTLKEKAKSQLSFYVYAVFTNKIITIRYNLFHMSKLLKAHFPETKAK